MVGVISSIEILEREAATDGSPETCDLLEVRLDMLDLSPTALAGQLGRLRLPLILTARHPDEGGHGALDATRRAALLEASLSFASFIDVELRSALDLQALIRKAQSRRIGVIGSFHDFSITPSDEVLRGAIDFGIQFNLDVVKIATTLKTPGDLARLLNLLDQSKRLPLSIMGMGPLGRASRLALAMSGSVFNYGHLGEANAPGQWPARQLKELLAEMQGARA